MLRLLVVLCVVSTVGCEPLWRGATEVPSPLCTNEMQLCLARRENCPGVPEVAFAEALRYCGAPTPIPELPDMAEPCDPLTLSSFKYVINDVRLPQSSGSKTYAYDYNLDGRTENQFKTVIQAITVAGLDLQMPVTADVAAGTAPGLLDLRVKELGVNTQCATLIASQAEASKPPPKFDGSDTFVSIAPRKWLSGAVNGGRYSSTPAADLRRSTEETIQLRLLPAVDGRASLVTLRGVHVDAMLSSAPSGVPSLIEGQLHGVIARADIDNILIPGLANLVTSMVNKDPMGSSTKTIINLYENQMNEVSKLKCMNTPAKCCKTNPMTCVILSEEVKISPVGSVFSSDLEAFDDRGQWAPSRENKNKNGMSVGLGFSAIRASF